MAINAAQICVRTAFCADADKGFDLEALFQCLEEEFDLPTFLVDGADGSRTEVDNKSIAGSRVGFLRPIP